PRRSPRRNCVASSPYRSRRNPNPSSSRVARAASEMRRTHLGPRGTHTEAAALLYDATAELVPCPTVAAAIATVERGEADAAVCAIENSIEGGVSDTLDQLLREDFALHVRGEVVLPIRHAL